MLGALVDVSGLNMLVVRRAHLPITLITSIKMVISPVVSTSVSVSARAYTHTNHLLTDSVSGPYFCMLVFFIVIG